MPDEIVIEIPNLIRIVQPYVYLLLWWFGTLIISMGLKITNKCPNVRAAVITALSILILYVACVLIEKYKPLGIDDYLAPLPFASIEEHGLVLQVYRLNGHGKICIPDFFSQVFSMFVLAFVLNQIYSFKPGNLKPFGWFVFRVFSTMFGIGIHFALHKLLQKALGMVPKDSFLNNLLPHLPLALLGGVLALFLLGTAKKPMGPIFKVVNIGFDGVHGFFYTNRFGVVVTRAIWTTAIITPFFFFLQRIMPVPVLPTSSLTLADWISLAALFLLWLFLGQRI